MKFKEINILTLQNDRLKFKESFDSINMQLGNIDSKSQYFTKCMIEQTEVNLKKRNEELYNKICELRLENLKSVTDIKNSFEVLQEGNLDFLEFKEKYNEETKEIKHIEEQNKKKFEDLETEIAKSNKK